MQGQSNARTSTKALKKLSADASRVRTSSHFLRNNPLPSSERFGEGSSLKITCDEVIVVHKERLRVRPIHSTRACQLSLLTWIRRGTGLEETALVLTFTA